MLLRVLASILLFAVITALFWRASGTLSPKRLNLISITFYTYAIMVYLGASLAYCGLLGRHYLIEKLAQDTIDSLFLVVVGSGIGLATIFLAIGFFSISGAQRRTVDAFFDAPVSLSRNEDQLFLYVAVLSFFGLLCTMYTFSVLGGMPIVDLLSGNTSESAKMRWAALHEFGGNAYIRNMGMIGLVPLCNFMSFSGWRITKDHRWAILFGLTCVLAMVALTWNLEKAPIAVHVMLLFVLACMLGFKPTNSQVAIVIACAAVLIIAGYYLTSGGIGAISFESGPLSRLVTTPTGTLGLHLQYFPDRHAFLDGASVQGYWATLFGLEEGGVRSGAVVMAIANPNGVANNTAGVMNAFFVGEAYANWGVIGIVVSVIVVGIVIGMLHKYIIGLSKTYFTVMAYIILVKFHFTTLLGGFVDYFSIANLVPYIVVLLPLVITKPTSVNVGNMQCV